ncbi:GNAT family N-acetyltransferase [Pradoshia eiseniae]|uniref:GNAT family N-acetyltransferase n=1 Tax=Pradoshia eiseniae TaxID=2064768 RepID=A0A2S7N3Q2_9BACI|nr:GNAT family N-acetyltransferase [Pradoshia eiseniae]PQD96712.1 GNAT family N-acetyltransferase [Pradoshia eiseniae]
MGEIHYRKNKKITANQLAEVFRASDIRRPVEDKPRLEKMLKHADILVTAWDGEKLIGVARALTDYSYCCYLSDLAVDQGYQHKGIGKQLVNEVEMEIGEEAALILLASPTAMDYYPKIGFNQIENGYMIPRKR